jgi:hypothetical protein
MSSFLSRYVRGEYELVWSELLAAGAAIRHEPLFSDASAVVQETMRRVRANIELLVARLEAIGYHFGIYPDGALPAYRPDPYTPPLPDIQRRLAHLESLVGPIPLSIGGFWQHVGSVDLIGTHPLWPNYADPLVVEPIAGAEAEYEIWQGDLDDGMIDERESFAIPIAPDYYHKANVSGGPFYRMSVPNAAIDGMVEEEWHQTTFVQYLRICFQAGGFPGIERLHTPLPEVLRNLSSDLLRF